MSDALIAVPDAGSAKVDTERVTVAGTPVDRQRVQIAGAGDVEIARVTNTTPGVSDFAVATRPVALPLPSGASTETTLAAIKAKTDNLDVLLSTRASETTLGTRVADATVTARLNVLGQSNMAGSAPVVLASNQSAIPVNQGTAAAVAGAWPTTNTDGTNVQAVKAASTAALVGDPAAVVSLSPNSPTPLNIDRSGSAALTALNQTATVSTNGCASAVFNISGTFVATLTLEASVDGSTWFAVVGMFPGATITGGAGAPSTIMVPCAGFNSVRLRVSAFTSGTANVLFDAGQGSNVAQVMNLNAAALNAQIVGPVAEAASASGNPVRAAGSDPGGLLRTVRTDTAGRLETVNRQIATFVVTTAGVAAGNLKSMLAVFNAGGSGVVLRLQRIYIRVTAGTALGADLTFQLHKLTASAGGTTLTPQSVETSDALNGSVTARTNGTFTEAGMIDRWIWESVNVNNRPQQNLHPLFDAGGESPIKAIRAAAGEGFHIKCATNSTAGTWDIVFYFTQE